MFILDIEPFFHEAVRGPELLPILIGLAHPEHHRQQDPLALLGESPGHQHSLLGPVGADRQEDRVQNSATRRTS